MPTCLNVAGVPLPKDRIIDGKNIIPAIKGKVKKLHDYFYWCSADGKWAISDGKWKIVHVRGNVELFDIQKDLSEKNDCAKKNPEKVKTLTRAFDKWLDEMADPMSKVPKRWDPSRKKAGKKKKNKKKKDRKKK